MSCGSMKHKLHEYLDGDLDENEERHLKEHLSQCSTCKRHLFELEKSLLFIRSLPRERIPTGFTQEVLNRLPKRKSGKIWLERLKRKPLTVAVSFFFILMIAGSALSWVEEGSKLRVLSSDKDQFRIEHGAVYVPAGEVIEGDLVVEHGDLKVDGAVKGNVVVIDGRVLLSSTARISGNTEELHRFIDVLMYRLRSLIQP